MEDAATEDPRLYLKLATVLRARIADGEILPGQKMPTIAAIADEQKVSRHTVSKALRLLARDGVIARVVGLGYFVQPGRGVSRPSSMHG